MNILVVFLWLVKQGWCEAILEQVRGSTSLGRSDAFSELKEQFHSGRTPGCQWGSLADGTLSSKSWYFISSHRRWSDLLCSRRCLHDHPDQTLEKETSQCTPQLVKTVVKEIMKVESSKQIRSLACCSVTTARVTWWLQPCQQMITQSSKKMFVVHPVKKNSEPWIWLLRKNEKQPKPWCLDCRLHVELGHSDTDSSSLQPKSSVAVRVKKVRDEDYVQWLLEFFMNLAHVFKLINLSGDIQC